jgi:valyl-tRNA synthetase
MSEPATQPAAMAKTYDFHGVEMRLYRWWQQHGWFKPESARDPAAEPFVIAIPPPNVTGELHLGHAMFVAIEDLMIRYQRMRGRRALWIPGTDHASIATQLQVEKLLQAQGTTREALGRDEFMRRTWEWKAKYGGIITGQLRRLGASCDWERERFTLDAGLSRAVREAFVRLYEKGLIYRGTYLINWSPGLKTAVSELEVEYSEEPGTLYTFKYPLAGRPGEFLPVATTRPETILGDTAVAVHPEDERYRHLLGETALVPVLERPIPIIADEAVDRSFGTGALKVTPGHDPTDYAIGQRHGLPIVSVMNPDATMNANAGPYAGQDRFECRRNLWADLERAGLALKTEPYQLNVPRTQRGGEIVEPLISTQWFVRIQPLAEAALAAVRDGRIRIVPERFVKVYYSWLENIRDWCISRQLWWGHRIPVWYCADCGEATCSRDDPTVCAHCGAARLEQDPDVLDTWFSSGLWPFSTLGWPDDTADLRSFYPTDVLETGYDILFFWVARMIMMGLEFTGEVPFHTVYLHGLVRDEQGRKMSKTLGNAVDPLEVMDRFGADALRFTLLTGSTPGNDMNLSLQRVEANRNFANKIWNAARFVVGNLGGGAGPVGTAAPALDALSAGAPDAALPERWIVSRLNQTIADVTRLIEDYQYGEAGRLAYDFLWGDYCDWYLEIAKIRLAQAGTAEAARARAVLVHVLDQTLRLLHPFIPFVTEEIWQHLRAAAGTAGAWPEGLMIAPWPQRGPRDEAAERAMAVLIETIRAIRNARAEYKVAPERRIAADVHAPPGHVLEAQAEIMTALARIDPVRLRFVRDGRVEGQGATLVVGAEVTVHLPLADLVDLDAERARLARALAEVEAQIGRSETLLASDFATRAPAAVVQRERAKLAELRAQRAKLAEQLRVLAG